MSSVFWLAISMNLNLETMLYSIGLQLHTLSPVFSLDNIVEGRKLELEVADDRVATLT